MQAVRAYLFGTLRGRLIVSVAAVHAVMMTLFIVDFVVRQRAMIRENQAEEAITMSQSLATSAAGWIAADDISGLQELVEAERRYPELLFAMLADENGRVLAHTDGTKRGLYLVDLPKNARQTMLHRSDALVDVAVPAMLGGKHVGWARVGIGQKAAAEKLSAITRAGFWYAVAAILAGSVIAWGMGRRITRRLYAIQETIGRVKRGEGAARSDVAGSDEAASISREFNAMLDSLEEREEALRASEERYHSLIHNSMDAILLTSPDGGVLSANPEACRIFGKTEEEICREGRSGVVDTTDPRLLALLEERARMGKFRGELIFLRKDGSRFPGEITTAVFRDTHGRDRTSMIIRDISERTRAEEALHRLNRELRAVSSCNQVMVRAESEQALIKEISRILCEEAGYRMAWVGYAENDETKTVRPVAWAGYEDGYLAAANISWADTERGRGPTGTAVRTGEIVYIQDFATDPRMALWRDNALRRGYCSSIALPLNDEHGDVFGAITIYSEKPNAFTPDEIHLLQELAVDLSFGIVAQRTRATREQAERELRHSEEKFSAAFHASPDLMAVTRLSDGAILEVNEAYTKLLGYTHEESVGRTTSELAIWADPADRERFVRSLETTGEINDFETRLRRKDGTLLNCLDSARSIVFAGEKCVLSVVHDITERKRMEEALRASEESLRKREAMLNESQRLGQIGSWDWDAVRDVIWWSDEYYRIYGFEPGTPPPNYEEHLKAYTPESAARLDAAVKRAMESGASYELDMELANPTATTRWIVARGEVKRDENGRIRGLRGTAQNITERKLAEEKLRKSEAFNRSILESVGEGFVVIDREYRILSANRAFLEQFHALPQDAIGKYCYQCIHHSDRPCFERGKICPTKHTFETGQPGMATHVHQDKEGAVIYMEIRSYPLRDAEGTITAVIEIMNNVTEKRKLEDQLRQAQKMEAIGALAGGIAHDFNNILTAIIGYGSIVKMKSKPDDPQRPLIDQILAASDRAAHLTQGLLAFSRKQVISLKPVDVNVVVRSIEKLLRRLIGEDVELVSRTAEQNLIVMADSGQLEQVLMNLATNARDAMPEGGVLAIATEEVEVREDFISAHGYGKPGRHAMITVSDTGAGMDEQTQAKIFDPFFTTKELGKGTGLGLAIVYGIVKQHEGNINVYSEPGRGTTFKIYLPLISAAVDAGMPGASLPPVGGTETILLAEDNSEVRTLNATVLREFGYRVIDAADGEEALEQYEAHAKEIDLLILDVIMPKKSGKDVSDAVRAVRPDAPVLFISGYTADVIQKKGVFGESVEFLSKPVSPYELLRKIRQMLDAGRRNRS